MNPETLSGTEKAAVLILSLEPEAARGLIQGLDDAEVERIAQTISTIEEVPDPVRESVLQEFRQGLSSPSSSMSGGRERALALLEGALDPDRAQRIRRTLGCEDRSISATLRAFGPAFVAERLGGEHPQTVAVVLSQIPAQTGAAVIAALPDALQADVVLRLADLEALDGQLLRELEDAVAELFGRAPGWALRPGGREAAARLLNRIGKQTGARILDDVDDRDSSLADEIRRRMLTFNDLAALPDRAFQQLLRAVSSEDLVVALKAASDAMRDKVFSNVSSRAANQMREDGELLGPMRLSEVEAVHQRVVEAAQALEEQGTISLDFGDSDDVLV